MPFLLRSDATISIIILSIRSTTSCCCSCILLCEYEQEQ
jgi:hypothetical protein